ncbi:MAG TPA: bifunctional phosphoribosylaminoimidazolecarboxamide formyltransferase/IMP cyclohydrolase [Anaerolineaceae bacterium]
MPTALISVSNKDGLIDFARALNDLGWKLLASGGTATAIRSAGLEVEEIATYTNSPEILDGRVKTLHPAVHGGILARNTASDKNDLERIRAAYIDMVVVNLYPFQKTVSNPEVTLSDAIENIDIGGVALIRAAAKNFTRVTVVTNPGDYPQVMNELRAHGQVTLDTRQQFAVRAFTHTAGYDTAIAAYLSQVFVEETQTVQAPGWLSAYPSIELRYGENPHQQARLYHLDPQAGPLGGEVLQGKALSYNNLLDLDAAWRASLSFSGQPAVAIVKHLSPCGIATAESLAEAFALALRSDPISAFGGVIAANQVFDAATVEAIGSLFVECIVAPGFSPEALERLGKRKNLRLVCVPNKYLSPEYEMRTVNGGILWQTRDFGDPPQTPEWQVVTRRQPTEAEWASLRFAWKACQHVKSNAIVLAQGSATVGIGGGQPNRVDCVRIAVERAGDRAKGSVMASDAFFPFPDSVEVAAAAGVTAIVQPGGSVRDAESIEAADKAGIAMVTTGVRHFRH